MFAGPNGSGKSTLKSVLPKELLGVYLNPDEIEDEIRKQGFLDLNARTVTTTADEVLPFFGGSSFLISAGFADAAKQLDFVAGRLGFEQVEVNSYFASVAVDFLGQKLLERKASFTLETVMSHSSKVALLEQAQTPRSQGFCVARGSRDPSLNTRRSFVVGNSVWVCVSSAQSNSSARASNGLAGWAKRTVSVPAVASGTRSASLV
jgi:hypothetical protein